MAYDADVAITLWPEYFDSRLTRAEGRRLPRPLCVENPSLDIIAKAAIILGLEYEVLSDKSYPKDHRRKRGCVKIEKGKIKKTQLLNEVGKILVKNSK